MTDSTIEPFDRRFGVTWDYRCPFARNAHEHLIDAIEGGDQLEVSWIPFSLSQMHVEEGEISVFDNPDKQVDLLAMEVALVVRDRFSDRWLDVHRALFALRHDDGGDLRDPQAIRAVLEAQSVDADAVFAEVESGWPLDTFRKEHEAAERDHAVWGVPTFIVDDQAAFVRIMTRPEGNADEAKRTIEHILRLFHETEINEFKHTSIPR